MSGNGHLDTQEELNRVFSKWFCGEKEFNVSNKDIEDIKETLAKITEIQLRQMRDRDGGDGNSINNNSFSIIFGIGKIIGVMISVFAATLGGYNWIKNDFQSQINNKVAYYEKVNEEQNNEIKSLKDRVTDNNTVVLSNNEKLQTIINNQDIIKNNTSKVEALHSELDELRKSCKLK